MSSSEEPIVQTSTVRIIPKLLFNASALTNGGEFSLTYSSTYSLDGTKLLAQTTNGYKGENSGKKIDIPFEFYFLVTRDSDNNDTLGHNDLYEMNVDNFTNLFSNVVDQDGSNIVLENNWILTLKKLDGYVEDTAAKLVLTGIINTVGIGDITSSLNWNNLITVTEVE